MQVFQTIYDWFGFSGAQSPAQLGVNKNPKRAGRKKGGRNKELKLDKYQYYIKHLLAIKVNKSDIARLTEVSYPTLLNYLKLYPEIEKSIKR